MVTASTTSFLLTSKNKDKLVSYKQLDFTDIKHQAILNAGLRLDYATALSTRHSSRD